MTSNICIWKFVSNKACSSPNDFNAIFPVNYGDQDPFLQSQVPLQAAHPWTTSKTTIFDNLFLGLSQEAIGLGLSVYFFLFFCPFPVF